MKSKSILGAIAALLAVMACAAASPASARKGDSWPPNSVIVRHLHCCLPTGSSITNISITRRGTIIPPRHGKFYGVYFAPGTILYAFTVTYDRYDTTGKYVNYVYVTHKVRTRFRENYIVYRDAVHHAWTLMLMSAKCKGPNCYYPGGSFGGNAPFGR